MAVTGSQIGIYKLGASGDTISGRLFVTYVRWQGTAATAAGHTVQIKNAAGVQIWESIADGAYFIDLMPVHRWINGISVTMSSGSAFVETR